MRFLAYLWDVAAPYTFTGLVDIDEARHDHEQMMDLFENDIGYAKKISLREWRKRPMYDRFVQWAVSRARYLL